jgi:DNA-binding transcriptional LysR family regulator
MDLRQLEYFVTVAEEHHFARAAHRLHVSQPSVSQQIKSLERELGVPLFERSSRAVSLTPAGSDILPLAVELLADARRLQLHAAGSARRVSGRVRIGFLADEYTNTSGDQLIAAIREAHPGLTIEFHQIGFAEQFSALVDAQVDVSFVMGPVPGSLLAVPLFQSPRLLAVSRAGSGSDWTSGGGAYSGAAVVLPNQITDHDWRRAWTPPGSATAQVFVVGESSMEAMLSAVGDGRGVCLVPEYVSRYYPQPAVRFLTIPDLEPCSVEVAVVRARIAEPAIAAFIRVAEGLTSRD